MDKAQLKATLRQSAGITFIVKAAPEVGYFDRLSVGDQVTATITEKILANPDASGAVACNEEF
jgi:hypothetical protein